MRANEITQIENNALSAEAVYRSVLTDYPDVLTVPQVSSVLGVSAKTVYGLLNSGRLKSLRVGSSYRVPKIFVLHYLKVLDCMDKK